MLRRLELENFAIIDALKLDFAPGLNVFSGETGAGKSIIIEALSFVLGDRGDSTMIKEGQSKMTVSAEFDSAHLTEDIKKQYALTAPVFTVKREMDGKGKNKVWINGMAASVSKLSETGENLVDFHGQHEHQTLIKSAVQLSLLDIFAAASKELKDTAAKYKDVKELEEKLNASRMSKEEKERMLDIYRFQLNEIDSAELKEGEDAELENSLPKLKHAGKLRELATAAYEQIYDGDNAVSDALYKAVKSLDEMNSMDSSLEALSKELKDALSAVAAAGEALGSYRDKIDVDPQTLDEALARHQKINRLKTKYGAEIKDILAKADELRESINNLESSDEKEQELINKLDKARAALLSSAEKLHDKRFAAAQKLGKEIQAQIKPLGFNEIRFGVSVEFDPENIGPRGGDKAEFLFSPNPGQSMRPLKNIASGGEMSRVMLGLRTVLSDAVPVNVFDEIDAGIGGAVGSLVGQKLKILARGRQVLCVTHLAQVAAYADKHFTVAKTAAKNTTSVSVTPLEGEKRTAEIARMLGGVSDKKSAAFTHADELLKTASR